MKSGDIVEFDTGDGTFPMLVIYDNDDAYSGYVFTPRGISHEYVTKEKAEEAPDVKPTNPDKVPTPEPAPNATATNYPPSPAENVTPTNPEPTNPTSNEGQTA